MKIKKEMFDIHTLSVVLQFRLVQLHQISQSSDGDHQLYGSPNEFLDWAGMNQYFVNSTKKNILIRNILERDYLFSLSIL